MGNIIDIGLGIKLEIKKMKNGKTLVILDNEIKPGVWNKERQLL